MKIIKLAAALGLGSALLASVTTAQPGAPIPSRAEFEAAQPQVDESLLPRIDHGDGTWSYLPSPSLAPEQRVQGEIIRWRYDGQARFSHDPQPARGLRHHVVTGEVESPFEQLTSVVRIDRWGHRWRAEAARQDAWAAAIVEEDLGSQELDDFLPPQPHDPPEAPGTVIPWRPLSWSHNNCVGGLFSAKEEHVWDGEGRTTVGTPDEWESTAVEVDAAGTCTGVILTQDFVLTAAHCVSDDRNNPVRTRSVQVCRFDIGSPRCKGVSDIQFLDSYGGGSGSGGGTDFDEDWALLELSSTWASTGRPSAEDMDLSRVGDSVLDSLDHVNNLGLPGFARGCTNFGGNTLVHNEEDEPLAATYRKSIRMKIDTGPGHSGGPVYYCPGGSVRDECERGDKAFVFAVNAGWNSLADRAVGPRMSFYRDTMIAIITD